MEPRLPQYTQFFVSINSMMRENVIDKVQKAQLEQCLINKEQKLLDLITKYAHRDMEQQFRDKVNAFIQSKQKESFMPLKKSNEKQKSNKFSLSARQISFSQDDPILENRHYSQSLSAYVSQQIEQLETMLQIHMNNEGRLATSDIQKLTQLRDSINKYIGNQLDLELDNESPVRCRNISVCRVIPDQSEERSIDRNVQNQDKYHIQIIDSIRKTYDQLKSVFSGSLHTHYLLMQEELSYNNLVTVVKSMIKELTDADEIYFLIKKGDECDFYSTEKDSIKQLNETKQDIFISNFSYLKPNIVYTFKNDIAMTEQLQQFLDIDNQNAEISVIRYLNQNKQEVYFFFYWKYPGEDILLRKFINEANEYGFQEEVQILANFLMDVIRQARVQYFSPVQFADQIQDIALSFVESSQYILIDQIKRALETRFKVKKDQAFSEDGREKIGYDGSIRIEMEGIKPITLIISNFNLNIPEHQYLYTQILNYKAKFYRHLKLCHEKTAYYKYFLRSTDTIVFDFDKKGRLVFQNHYIWEALKKKYNILFSPDKRQPYFKDIFTDDRILNYIDVDEFMTKKKNQYIQHEDFEIFLKVVDQTYKGFVIIFHLQEGSRMKDYIKNLKNEESLEDEIKQSIQRSYNKHQTFKFINQLQKTNPSVKNSQIALYLPEEPNQECISLKPRKQRLSIQMLGKMSIRQFVMPTPSKQRIKSIESAQELEEDDDLDELYQDLTIDGFDFNVFAYNDNMKPKIVYHIFCKNDWIDNYDIAQDTLMRFIREVERKYNKRKNPFHNFDHGVSVMQSCHYLCLHSVTHNLISDIVHFATVVSGLCHDVSHTARTNQFEINSRSKLANRYLDKSPLEHHHSAVTLRLLNQDQYNILSNLTQEDQLIFRQTLIENILYTDIKQHFALIKDFEQRVKEGRENPDKAFGTIDGDIKLFTGMIVHTSDFSGAAKTFDLSRKWTEKVNREFMAQYNEEGNLSIVQTAFLKDLDKEEIMAKNEMGFFKVIVRPTWASLNDFYEKQLQEILQNVDNTIITWEKIYHTSLESVKIET